MEYEIIAPQVNELTKEIIEQNRMILEANLKILSLLANPIIYVKPAENSPET